MLTRRLLEMATRCVYSAGRNRQIDDCGIHLLNGRLGLIWLLRAGDTRRHRIRDEDRDAESMNFHFNVLLLVR